MQRFYEVGVIYHASRMRARGTYAHALLLYSDTEKHMTTCSKYNHVLHLSIMHLQLSIMHSVRFVSISGLCKC